MLTHCAMIIALIPTENSKIQLTTQTRHQNFDYTTSTDRLRIVSWSKIKSHSTVVFKPVYGLPKLPTHHKICVIT